MSGCGQKEAFNGAEFHRRRMDNLIYSKGDADRQTHGHGYPPQRLSPHCPNFLAGTDVRS